MKLRVPKNFGDGKSGGGNGGGGKDRNSKSRRMKSVKSASKWEGLNPDLNKLGIKFDCSDSSCEACG